MDSKAAHGTTHPAKLIFRNARIFDGDSAKLLEGFDVLVAGDTIEDVVETPMTAPNAPREVNSETEIVDCGGRVLMPGLIDAHVHVYAAGLNLTRVAQWPMSYLAHYAAEFLHGCLDR